MLGWNSGVIERQVLNVIAVAVQRGNALTMLAGLRACCDSEFTKWK